jgi:GT2 family glycosyltransferase
MHNDMSQESPIVYITQVHFNSLTTHGEECIRNSLAAAREQAESLDGSIKVLLIDNASTDGTAQVLQDSMTEAEVLIRLPQNIGFCGGHNLGAYHFLQSSAQYLLLLNPDLKMEPYCIRELVTALANDPTAGTACPLLLRGGTDLERIVPEVVDAAGMTLTSSLRHFDIGSGARLDQMQMAKQIVFGGSGACLLLSRDFVEKVSFRAEHDTDVFKIFPQLEVGYETRTPLFDEAFFAYREDAELAWRGQHLGFKCWFVPDAVAIHRRVVTPERRGELSPFINMLGVQNRFLLQGNCYFFRDWWCALVPGVLWRNVVVVAGVMLTERASFKAFTNIRVLFRRMRARRKTISHRKSSLSG